MRSIVSLALALASLAACNSDAQRSVVASVGTRLDENVEGGIQRRVTTAHGALHVWTPRHYSESADIVVYVGDPGRQLAKEFATSGLDAMFITCDASWASLAEVLGTTQRATGLPSGRVIVVGDATVEPWMVESQLDRLVMTDVQGDAERYRDWVNARKDRQLIFVGANAKTEALHALLPEAKVAAEMPVLGQARGARVVYVKSPGAALPVLLQMAGDDVGTPIAGM